MAALTPSTVLFFVYEYYRRGDKASEWLKNQFEGKGVVIYPKKTIKEIVYIIVKFDPSYSVYIKQGLTPENIGTLLDYFWSQNDWSRFEKASKNNTLITPDTQKEFEVLDKEKDPVKREQKTDSLISQVTGFFEIPQIPLTPESSPTPQISLKPRLPGFLKEPLKKIASSFLSMVKVQIIRHPMLLSSFFTGLLGGVLGSSQGPFAALGGFIAGFSTPTIITKAFGAQTPISRVSTPGSPGITRIKIPAALLRGVGAGVGAGARVLLLNPWVLGGIVLVILILVLISLGLLKTNSLFPPYEQQAGVFIPTTTSISSCQFSRAGSKAPFKSLILLGWVAEAASKEGIPPSILASIARHESPEFTTNADDTHEAIQNNYYCNPGKVFCELKGKNIHMGACTAEEISGGARNARAIGLIQVVDVFNPDLDLCNIKENLARGARIFKEKLASTGLSITDEDGVKKAVCGYYGITNSTVCPYQGSYDYAKEVWDDYISCGTGGPAGFGTIGLSITCPLGNQFKINCGTAVNPVGNCGHGHPTLYQVCKAPPYAVCPFSDQLKKSIDVVLPSGNAAGAAVLLPYINGNVSIGWSLIKGPEAIKGGSWGYKAIYEASYGDKKLTLDLTHINSVVKSAGFSGEQIGAVYSGTDGEGRGHLHTAIAVDGVWVEAEKEAFMCSYETPVVKN